MLEFDVRKPEPHLPLRAFSVDDSTSMAMPLNRYPTRIKTVHTRLRTGH